MAPARAPAFDRVALARLVGFDAPAPADVRRRFRRRNARSASSSRRVGVARARFGSAASAGPRSAFAAPEADGVLTVHATSRADASLQAYGGDLAYQVGDGRIEVDNRKPAGRYALEVPTGLSRLTVIVGGRLVFDSAERQLATGLDSIPLGPGGSRSARPRLAPRRPPLIPPKSARSLILVPGTVAHTVLPEETMDSGTVGVFIPIAAILAWGAVRIATIQAQAKRTSDPQVSDRLQSLEHEVGSLRQELGEAQERIDFAERLLAQQRPPERLDRG
jgi:hypothetical protein